LDFPLLLQPVRNDAEIKSVRRSVQNDAAFGMAEPLGPETGLVKGVRAGASLSNKSAFFMPILLDVPVNY
jgi:hypothetical protein